ncbi:MAG: hypothetical protein AAF224_05030 [Pseudomonadota bacterium]
MKRGELENLLTVIDAKLTADMAQLSAANRRRRELEEHAALLRLRAIEQGTLEGAAIDPIDFSLAADASAARARSAGIFEDQARAMQPAVDAAKAAVRKSLAKKDVLETLLTEQKRKAVRRQGGF